MIYKYGGFYLDLDYVVFNDLRDVVNHFNLSAFLQISLNQLRNLVLVVVNFDNTSYSQFENIVVGNKP